ncbi:hypothetical protein GCM10027399_14320 [Curvibacter fontanus]|mgnify:CR=1 FL=1|uniref:hypothetical protein n=1 Tax=Hydrogenophaga sp. TaxID=1904254 RepID=UPI00271A17BF|nr:hypothetical protein [Hydrogenophaga sp.]MDO9220925.1 hypothetical protein [Thiobacillus sp.]MDP1619592.1 hypothetical protein [bacterium]MDP1936169.1 hypothetical protein [Hylemonella sp.]MDZ4102467.1 hypothetical protein [Hydrogenophaga sp.]
MNNDKTKADPSDDEAHSDAQMPPTQAQQSAGSTDAGWGMLLFFGVVFLIMLSLIFWPWTYRAINSIGVPAQRQYIGTVQKITYVGGFGANTQIDTESRTLLLNGVANLQKGERLEERLNLMDSDVCKVGTDQCWHLMGS